MRNSFLGAKQRPPKEMEFGLCSSTNVNFTHLPFRNKKLSVQLLKGGWRSAQEGEATPTREQRLQYLSWASSLGRTAG